MAGNSVSGVVDEHDFTVNRDQWEDAVFLNATHFRVVDPERNATIETKSFAQALIDAKLGPRCLVYAVSTAEHAVLCPVADYPRLLTMWTTRMMYRGLAFAANHSGTAIQKRNHVMMELVEAGCQPGEAKIIADGVCAISQH